jgi:hypothetical protein
MQSLCSVIIYTRIGRQSLVGWLSGVQNQSGVVATKGHDRIQALWWSRREWGGMWAVPRLLSYTLAFALQHRKTSRRNRSQGRCIRVVPCQLLPCRYRKNCFISARQLPLTGVEFPLARHPAYAKVEVLCVLRHFAVFPIGLPCLILRRYDSLTVPCRGRVTKQNFYMCPVCC